MRQKVLKFLGRTLISIGVFMIIALTVSQTERGSWKALNEAREVIATVEAKRMTNLIEDRTKPMIWVEDESQPQRIERVYDPITNQTTSVFRKPGKWTWPVVHEVYPRPADKVNHNIEGPEKDWYLSDKSRVLTVVPENYKIVQDFEFAWVAFLFITAGACAMLMETAGRLKVAARTLFLGMYASFLAAYLFCYAAHGYPLSVFAELCPGFTYRNPDISEAIMVTTGAAIAIALAGWCIMSFFEDKKKSVTNEKHISE